MAWLQRIIIPAVLAGLALPVAADDFNPQVTLDRPLLNTYIVELEDGEASERYLDALRAEPGVDTVTQRFAYSPDLFNAVSFEVEGSLTASPDQLRRRMADLPELKVKHVWPVEIILAPKLGGDEPAEIFNLSSSRIAQRQVASFPPHEMIQVDMLHEEGYIGNGTRIGVIDSGVDWRHPALGGCFGPGCLIEYGYDLVGENYNGDRSTLEPDDDPWEQCNGHGTAVSGVIAAQTNPLGFIGAAPGVKLGVYRVFSCLGASSTDVMIAAILRAYEDGSDIITTSVGTYSGWTGHPLSEAMSRVSKAGVPCTAAAGNSAGGNYGIFSVAAPSTGRDVLAIASYDSTRRPSINGETGQVSGFSLWGPTFEGDFKPQFGTPGGSILTTAPGGYTVTSGTSFAAPLTAASIALVFGVRGKLPTDEVRNLLAITAKPARSGSSGLLEPVAHQGAGLLQVYDAAYATARTSVSSLAFNDTEFIVPEKEFVITNSGDAPVVYTLSHVAADTVEALWPNGYRRSTPEVVPQVSSLKIEPSTLTLQPGAEGSVRVTVTVPEGLAAGNLPVYGGYISITGASNGQDTSLSIPYMGIGGAMRKVSVLAVPSQYGFTRHDDPWFEKPPARAVFQLPVPAAHPDWARPITTDNENYIPLGSYPAWYYWMKIGTPVLRFELIPVAPSCRGPKPVLYENVQGDETLGSIAGFPKLLEVPVGGSFGWSGRLADGSWVPPGRYRMRLYALRHLGDRNKAEDWDVHDFEGTFGLTYVKA